MWFHRVGNASSDGSEEEIGARLLAFGGHAASEQETHEGETLWQTVTLSIFVLKTNQSQCAALGVWPLCIVGQ